MGYTWTSDVLLSLTRKAGLTQDVRVPIWRVHDDAHEVTPDKNFYVLAWVVLMVNGGTRYEINCKRASGESGLASTQVLKPRKFTRITLIYKDDSLELLVNLKRQEIPELDNADLQRGHFDLTTAKALRLCYTPDLATYTTKIYRMAAHQTAIDADKLRGTGADDADARERKEMRERKRIRAMKKMLALRKLGDAAPKRLLLAKKIRTRPIWQHPCFVAEFCDPFLGGTGMDDGDAFAALTFLALVLQRLVLSKFEGANTVVGCLSRIQSATKTRPERITLTRCPLLPRAMIAITLPAPPKRGPRARRYYSAAPPPLVVFTMIVLQTQGSGQSRCPCTLGWPITVSRTSRTSFRGSRSRHLQSSFSGQTRGRTLFFAPCSTRMSIITRHPSTLFNTC